MNQTEQLRDYCERNKGAIFDFNYLCKTTFNNIPLANLRKYITRLVEEGILFQISKGLFVIGKPNGSVEELIINYYLSDYGGIPAGKYLLYLEGILDIEPRVKAIISKKIFSSKNIDNIIVKYVNNDYSFSSGKLMKLLELINCESLLEECEKLSWILKIHEYLRDYNDTYFDNHKICYPRIIYIKLANFLNNMHVSNRVMQIYDDKNEIQYY